MTPERYAALDAGLAELSPDEIAAGWHWCAAWDFILIGPGMAELEHCECDSPPVAKAREDWRSSDARKDLIDYLSGKVEVPF